MGSDGTLLPAPGAVNGPVVVDTGEINMADTDISRAGYFVVTARYAASILLGIRS